MSLRLRYIYRSDYLFMYEPDRDIIEEVDDVYELVSNDDTSTDISILSFVSQCYDQSSVVVHIIEENTRLVKENTSLSIQLKEAPVKLSIYEEKQAIDREKTRLLVQRCRQN